MALQDECLTDRTKVEDFLQALGDLCVEALARGEPFPLPEIGTIRPIGLGARRIVGFATSERIKDRLGTPPPLCTACKKNEREPRRKKCAECRQHVKQPKLLIGDDCRFSLLIAPVELNSGGHDGERVLQSDR